MRYNIRHILVVVFQELKRQMARQRLYSQSGLLIMIDTLSFFESAVINLLKATRNQTKTAELMRCGFNVVNRIIHRSVERGEKKEITKR